MKKILEKFDGGDYQFATVAKDFKLIEENSVTVYIDQEPEAKALLQEIRQLHAQKQQHNAQKRRQNQRIGRHAL